MLVTRGLGSPCALLVAAGLGACAALPPAEIPLGLRFSRTVYVRGTLTKVKPGPSVTWVATRVEDQ